MSDSRRLTVTHFPIYLFFSRKDSPRLDEKTVTNRRIPLWPWVAAAEHASNGTRCRQRTRKQRDKIYGQADAGGENGVLPSVGKFDVLS